MNTSNISDPVTLAALQQQQAQQAQAATQQPLQTPGASHQQLQQQQLQVLQKFWNEQVTDIQTRVFDFKLHQLPLARIKKVMKADEDVKMISAEAPVLFAKGCDIFITELTLRAWIHAEENKRRTLQRSDIAMAITKTDMFDFLIDIVPREEAPRLPQSHMKSEKMDYRLDPNAAAVSPYHYTSYSPQLVDPALLAYQQQALSQAQSQQIQFIRQQQILQQQQQTPTQQQAAQSQAQPQQQQQQHLGSSPPSNSGTSTDRGQTQGQDTTSRNSSHQGLSTQGSTDTSAEAYYAQYGQGSR